MEPYHKDGQSALYHGDGLEVMPMLQENSAHLILTDPPYYKVKKEAWDNQWKSPAKFIEWLSLCAVEWKRLLKPNGSLYCFASPQMAARVEVMLSEHFNVLNHIVWDKSRHGGGKHRVACKDAFRGYFPVTERIIFCEQYGADSSAIEQAGYQDKCKESAVNIFGDYLKSEFGRAGVRRNQISKLFPSATGGITGCVSNWLNGNNIITNEQYVKIREYLNGEYLRKDYEELRKDYEELRKDYEELRRPFSVTKHDEYTDVWQFMPVMSYAGKHPCEKPRQMLQHIVMTSTKKGDTVLDSMMGMGSAGKAAKVLERQFVGIDLDEINCKQAKNRIVSQRIERKLPGM